MLSLDGAEHARHRGPWVPAWRRADVRQRLGGIVAAETDRLIDGFEAAGRADLRATLAGPLAAAVVGHALGLEADPFHRAALVRVDRGLGPGHDRRSRAVCGRPPRRSPS